MKMKVLVIIPAYNEALSISKVVKDIKSECECDYVVINDCSKDDTERICRNNNYDYVSLPINYGLASAIQVGMKYALINNYDIAIQFDGDGQHKAEYIKDLINEVEEGYDIVIGSRFLNEKKRFSLRSIGNTMLSFLIKVVTGKTIRDTTSGMRAYDRRCIEELVYNINLPPEPDTLVYMIKNGFKIKEVQVKMNEREFGESYLNGWKSIQYMINMGISILFIQTFRKKRRR